MQAVGEVCVQVHTVVQHAPRKLHGLGVHAVAHTKEKPVPVQVALVAPVVQVQLVRLQQTPRQGEGVHEPPQ
jgi:hypothetical protein